MLGFLFFITRGRETDPDSDARYLCAQCREHVADAADVLSVLGRPVRRVYENPHGVECDVVTLGHCLSYRASPFSTAEHTWFPGYAWRPLGCGACASHLGWRFEAEGVPDAQEPEVFYGLLMERLIVV